MKRALLVATVLGGLAHHVIVLARFGGFGWDEMWQLAAARSFVAGHGLSIPDAYFPDVERVWYRPVVGWPPGYALIASALLNLTPDLWTIALGIDVAATVLFFLSLLAILGALGELAPLEVRTGVLLWLGFAASPLKGFSPSDRLALALYLAGIALALPVFAERRRHRMLLAISSGIVTGLSGWVRFAYWPLTPLIGLALWLAGLPRGGGKAIWRYAVAQVTAAALVVGGVAAYQRNLTGGHATFLSVYYMTVSPGFHWENLTFFNPFASSLTGLSDLSSALGLPGRPALEWTATLVLLAAAGSGLGRSLRDRLVSRGVSYLVVVSLLTFLTCVGMLTYVSLNYPKNAEGWTFVQEARYFAPTLLVIYVGLVLAFGALPRRVVALLTAGRGIGLAAGIALVAIFLAGHREGPFGFLYRDQFAAHLRWSYVVMEQEVKRLAASGDTAVYVDRDETRRGVAGLAGARALQVKDATEVWLARMPQLRPRVPSDVDLLVALPTGEHGYRSPAAREGVMSACTPAETLLDRTPLYECRGQTPRMRDRWKVATVGDFNGDGKPDLMWRNTTSGGVVVWYLQGLERAGERAIPQPMAPGPEWEIVGAADIDGDGKWEVFCRYGAASLRIWRLDDPRPQWGPWLAPSRSPETRGHAVAVADFDHDDEADVLWQDGSTANVAIGLMHGLRRASTVFTTPPGPPDALWRIAAVGDFDGDGNVDLLWREWFSGATTVWLMNGFSRQSAIRFEPPGAADRWQPAGAADFDGDGKAEIVWNDVQTGTVRIVPSGGGSALEWSFPR